MGGRGSKSGFGGGAGSGWGKSQKLTGTEKQVSWANEIIDRMKLMVDFNIKSNADSYNKLKDNNSMIKRDLYSDFKKSLSGVLEKTSKASDVIRMKDTALNPSRIQSMIDEKSREMTAQIRNGWKYDKKTHTTKK